MFGIGKNKGKHKELEEILDRIKMYMENNYKDFAKDAFAQLKDKFNMLKNSGKLKAAQEENKGYSFLLHYFYFPFLIF